MLPLTNLFVLDLSQGPVGGLATMILSDFGAQVYKVDGPDGDQFADHPAVSLWTRGKHHYCLDLTTETDRATFEGWVREADVVVTGGPIADLVTSRTNHETLAALNSQLIYCHISAMGEDEPIGPQQLNEGVVAASAGRMLGMEGISRVPGPAYPVVQVATHATAMNTVTGVLAAIYERKRSGRGQKIHTSLVQGLMPYDMGGSLAAQMRARRGKEPARAAQDQMPPLNYHPAQCKDGKWIQLGNLLAHLYDNYLRATGLQSLREAPPF